MHGFFRKRLLQKRIVALAMAYAIALASLLANLGGAQMAAAAAGQPNGVICHTDLAGDPARSPNGGTGNTCADNCCTGCLMLMAALPPPPATAAAIVRSDGERIALPAATDFIVSSPTKSHRSRAPPQSL